MYLSFIYIYYNYDGNYHHNYNSKLLASVVWFAQLVYVTMAILDPIQIGFIRLHYSRSLCTVRFLPRPARKESNVPKLKSRKGLTVLIYILCSLLPCLVRSLLNISMKTYCRDVTVGKFMVRPLQCHSDLKCPITFVNSKMVKFQILNFFLL